MVVVDTKPVILPNLHNDHMDGVKWQLRKVAQLRPFLVPCVAPSPPPQTIAPTLLPHNL